MRSIRSLIAEISCGVVARVRLEGFNLARRSAISKFNRLAIPVGATLLSVGIALIAVWAVRAFDMLAVAEVDRAPIIIGVLIALAVLVVLCLIACAVSGLSAASHRVDGWGGGILQNTTAHGP